MEKYLLDTNVISELKKSRPHGAVTAWFNSVSSESLFLPAAVAGEIEIGIQRTLKSDQFKARDLSIWLDGLFVNAQWVDAGPDVFRIWGRIVERSNPALLMDALIAATAIHNRMILVTRNERDYMSFDVRLLNPFAYAG